MSENENIFDCLRREIKESDESMNIRWISVGQKLADNPTQACCEPM